MNFSPWETASLLLAILTVAFLYSSVGHGGASGYIAVLTLAGLTAAQIKPIALLLNILVASIGAYHFWRAGHFSWSLFWPFAVFAVPAAYFGGQMKLPTETLKTLLGVVLWLSAARLFWKPQEAPSVAAPPTPLAALVGGLLGLLSGITGTGGGIFLTPLMLLCRWAKTKTAAAVSAPFIVVNSISGLAGHLQGGGSVPAGTTLLAVAAVTGGVVGSRLGSRQFSAPVVRVLLAVVLLVAGGKLLWT